MAIAIEKTDKSPTINSFTKRHSLTLASSVSSVLGIFLRNGLIIEDDENYRINDPLLSIFINRHYSVPEF